MSDETPETPPPHEPPHPHEHAGVVETLREELHEVVEHVPQPVRWTVGKLVRVAVISLALLLVVVVASAALYLANRTELVARELTLVINHALAQRSDLVLTMHDIKGNPFTGVRVIEPRVRFRSDGATLLAASEMRVGYSAIGLLRGGGRPVEVVLRKPVVHLDGGANGSWRLPKWQAGPASGKPARPLGFVVTIEDAEVHAPKPLGLVQDLDLKVTGATGAATRVTLERMRYAHGPWHSRLDELAAEMTSDRDSVHVRLKSLRTGDVAVHARADWRAGGSVQRFDVDVKRVRWRWLAEVFDNDEFDVPGEGHLTASVLHGARWQGRFTADASWDSLALVGRGLFAWDGKSLALDSLAATSLAGNLSRGTLRWSKQGWALAGDAQQADPAHWHALRLDHWPAGKLDGSFKYVLDSRGRENESRLDVRVANSVWTGWAIDSGTVRVDFPAVGRDSFMVVAWRRGGRFTLDASVHDGGWGGPYTVETFPLEEWPDGRASGLRGTLEYGEGRVDAKGGQLFVTGDLEGGVTDWSATHFANWRMTDVDGRLLPTPDLTANVVAHDGFFVGVHLDSAAAAIQLGDGNVAYTPAHAWAGDTLFTGTGTADWTGARWRTRLTSASAASAQFAWTANPPLEFSGDPQGTLFDRVIADDGEAHLEARGRWAAPGGFYDFSLDATRLDLGRLGLPLDWELAGRGDARLAIRGRSGDPRWTFDGRASRPGFGGHRCDTMSVALAGQPHALEVRDFLFGLERGTARGHGHVERTPNPFPDSLTATAVIRWLQDAAAWEGRLEANRLTVSHLGAFAPKAEGWNGTLDGSLSIAGSPPHPEFDVEATADDFGYREYRAQRVQARASYHAGVLDVPSTIVTMQDVASTIRGRMPVTLALGRAPELPDERMEWNVDVPRGDLKLLPALIPMLQSARGRFDLAASVGGTARHPRVAGTAHIRDGTVRPAGREEVIESVYADLRFDESRITLDSLTARQGRTGQVWSRGSVVMNGFDVSWYAFDLRMRDFVSSQGGLYAMLFDGDFQVVNGPRVRGLRVPQVLGDVRLKRGVIEFDFANQSEVQRRMAITEPLYWTYRIHLGAARNLHWQPPNSGDIEFTSDLDLEQTADSLLIFGEMHLVKGYYYDIFGNRYTLSQADLTFDNQKGVDPTMDIVAETRLKPSRRELAQGDTWNGGTPATETITVRLTGRSSQAKPELSSSSGWDQREILGEISYGRFTTGGNAFSSAADPLQNYLVRQISNQLTKDLSKFFNDAINQWEVERDQGALISGAGSVVMSVGGDLSPRASWTYKQRLPGLDRRVTEVATPSNSLFDRDVAVEYRINRFIYATTEMTQRRTTPGTTVQNNTEFNVNLKARWEY